MDNTYFPAEAAEAVQEIIYLNGFNQLETVGFSQNQIHFYDSEGNEIQTAVAIAPGQWYLNAEGKSYTIDECQVEDEIRSWENEHKETV